MTRILFFILVVAAFALGLAWFADRPGTVTLQWLGYQVETSAFVAALLIAAFALAVVLVVAAIRYIWTRPAAIAANMHARKQKHGFDALSRGLLAVGVGDRTQAQRYAGIAARNLPREPLTALLRAQAAQLKGDEKAARMAFEAMLEAPDTEMLGIRGLFLEAQRAGDENAARALAEQAVRRNPKLAWGVNALFDIEARSGDWDDALNTLAIARQNGHVDADTSNRRRAVLLTAEARETEAFDPDKALRLANEALRLAPALVPAAEIAGRLFTSKGETRTASKQIERTWKLSPHPDLAVSYAFAKPGLAPKDRLKRVEYLASLTPGDKEADIAVAQAAVDAQEWQRARDALASYIEDAPSARICTLMARIEGGSGDKGREREWLARALRAPRDRAWIADGYISDRWLPVSPVTGTVGAFEWKAPADAIGRPDETLHIEEWTEPPRDPSAMLRAEEPHVAETPVVVDVTPTVHEEPQSAVTPLASPVINETAEELLVDKSQTTAADAPAEVEPASDADGKNVSAEAPQAHQLRSEKAAEPVSKPEPSVYVPVRPPDDPGVSTADNEESPTSLERLRAAQIR